MNSTFSAWARRLAVVCGGALVSACVSNGGNLRPGVSTLPEVIAEMGQPAMAWKNPDGSEQLAYPRGPAGTKTFMASVGPDGKLQRIENVLSIAHFSRVRVGMTKDEVLRILGPSGSLWTQTYTRSNLLAWSWLVCDDWSLEEFFDVMFDVTTGLVHSTGRHPNLVGTDGAQPWCSK